MTDVLMLKLLFGTLAAIVIGALLIERIAKKKKINKELVQEQNAIATVNWNSFLAVLDVQPTNRFSISVWENSKNDFGGDLKGVTLRAVITRLLDKLTNSDKLFELEIITFNSVGAYRYDQEKIRSYYKEQLTAKNDTDADLATKDVKVLNPYEIALIAIDCLTNVVNNLKKGNTSSFYNGSPITLKTIESINKFVEDTKNPKI